MEKYVPSTPKSNFIWYIFHELSGLQDWSVIEVDGGINHVQGDK